MWIVEFCARHSSHCVQAAEECTDAERRQAWLRLAQGWVQVADQARASGRRDHANHPPGPAEVDSVTN